MSTAQRSIWLCGPAARLLTRPCGFWRIPHGIGVPGTISYMPYRVLCRVSVLAGYSAQAAGAAS